MNAVFSRQPRTQAIEHRTLDIIRQPNKCPAQARLHHKRIHQMLGRVHRDGQLVIACRRAKAEHFTHIHKRHGAQHGLFVQPFDVGDRVFRHGLAIGRGFAGHGEGGEVGRVDGDRVVVGFEEALDSVAVRNGFGVCLCQACWADIVGRCRRREHSKSKEGPEGHDSGGNIL